MRIFVPMVGIAAAALFVVTGGEARAELVCFKYDSEFAVTAAEVEAEPAFFERDAESEILAEINFARTRPQDYARRLLLQPISSWEAALRAGGDIGDEGAYAEAIEFLMRQSPLPPLTSDDVLRAAASEHADAQGAEGAIGHSSADGERFDARLRRHGVVGAIVAENIAYGPEEAADVVRELIIDRGVASRGHRRTIFHPDLQTAGAQCGPHKTYGAMCVIDFASRPQAPSDWRLASVTSRGGTASRFFRLLSR